MYSKLMGFRQIISQLEWVEFEITGEDVLEIKYKDKDLTEAYISLEKPHSAYVQ